MYMRHVAESSIDETRDPNQFEIIVRLLVIKLISVAKQAFDEQ